MLSASSRKIKRRLFEKIIVSYCKPLSHMKIFIGEEFTEIPIFFGQFRQLHSLLLACISEFKNQLVLSTKHGIHFVYLLRCVWQMKRKCMLFKSLVFKTNCGFQLNLTAKALKLIHFTFPFLPSNSTLFSIFPSFAVRLYSRKKYKPKMMLDFNF